MPHSQSIPPQPEEQTFDTLDDALREIAREGARSLLQRALEAEIAAHLNRYTDVLTDENRKAVVRNGYAPERTILTGVGPVQIQRPRVDEREAVRKNAKHEQFTSTVLPRFLRRTPSIEGTIATLYLKGISSNDCDEVLVAIFGDGVGRLSPNTVSRLKEVWEDELEQWRRRSLSGNEYAYIWADGVYFNARIEGDRSCLLVILGATYNGDKELLGIQAGYRESEESWTSLLLGLRDRGMTVDPKLAVADGALGFWKALSKVFPTIKGQRCWVHKTANVLDKMPKRVQPQAKRMIHEIYMAETEEEANGAFDRFITTYEDKYENAVTTLVKDRDLLLSFYQFPAAHWRHIRTTNVIESVFATVRLRTYKTKGMGTHRTTLAMAFKLIKEAEKRWHKIAKWQQLELVHAGRVFTNGVLDEEAAA